MTTTDDRVDAALAALPYDQWRSYIDPYGSGTLDLDTWRQIIRTAIEAADQWDRDHPTPADYTSRMVPMTDEEVQSMGWRPNAPAPAFVRPIDPPLAVKAGESLRVDWRTGEVEQITDPSGAVVPLADRRVKP